LFFIFLYGKKHYICDMKNLINFLLIIGFEDADRNFLFLQHLIQTYEYHSNLGMTEAEFDEFKLIQHLNDVISE
jgi:hypothetical protein